MRIQERLAVAVLLRLLMCLCISPTLSYTSSTEEKGGWRAWLACKWFSECCPGPFAKPNIERLRSLLKERLHGQHLVVETVPRTLEQHLRKTNPGKALVYSFHGPTGTGKNFVANLIAESLYEVGRYFEIHLALQKGSQSQFVKKWVATKDFYDRRRIADYKRTIHEEVEKVARKCDRSLFIFDEVDKMPEEILDALKPYVDHHESLGGVDYRGHIFIFLSNHGADDAAERTLKSHIEGHPRESLQMRDFDDIIALSTYNDQNGGGLVQSALIQNHLIDHYVPFMPLERKHVEMCVRDHLVNRGDYGAAGKEAMIRRIADELVYYPKEGPVQGIFSSSGCKKIEKIADRLIGEGEFREVEKSRFKDEV